MPQEPHDKPIRGDILQRALEKFDFLGQTSKELFIEEIEKQGTIFDDRHYYSLKEINDRFTKIFGKEVTPLLTYRLTRILNDLKMLVIASIPTVQFGFICITSSCVCFICNCLGMMQATM